MLLLAACSQDEMLQVNHDGDEIRFNAVANSAARAADVYCPSNLPSDFYVSAKIGSKSYISKDQIKNESGKWVNQNGTRYWPNGENDAVDFYASNYQNFTWDAANANPATIANYAVNTTVANQEDLLYAVKLNQKKVDHETAPVNLNFRHALSQIVFQARNDSKNLYVEIDGVSVKNVVGTGTFTFPNVNTDGNIAHIAPPTDGTYDDSDFPSATITSGTQGTWNLGENPAKTAGYSVTFTKASVSGNKQLVSLTTANEIGKEYNSNAMLLLPQTTTAWDPETYPNPGNTGNTNSYFLVKCAIYNVATPDADALQGGYDAATDICLWPGQGETTTKEVAIPVPFNWEQGKKYVYTLVFGNGNGGYDPEDPDDKPDPVLIPISFEVTVDEFIPVDGGDIESGVSEEEGA